MCNIYSCGGYSPATSTVSGEQSFTLTRSYRQGIRNTYILVLVVTIINH